jgi:thiamine-phosphate pyrophosphorylase
VHELRAAIRRAIRAGVDLVQIREKDLSGRELMELARWAVKEARAGWAKIIVNDRLDVAIASGAAGVHLGRESAPAKDVVRWVKGMRGRRAAAFLVGVSCHSMEEAREAERDGADYVHFGPVFETPSKRKFGKPQGVEKLREVCEAVRIPVLAVGGVDERKIEECLRVGAAGIAGIRIFQGKVKNRKAKANLGIADPQV